MTRKLTALLMLLALLVTCLAVPAQAATWPTDDDLEMSCWSQDDTSVKEDMSMFPDMTTLGSGLYMSPTLFVTNSTSSARTFSMYWMVDDNKVDFGTVTVEAGKRGIMAMGSETASKYNSSGLHFVDVYFDGEQVYSYIYWPTGTAASDTSTDKSAAAVAATAKPTAAPTAKPTAKPTAAPTAAPASATRSTKPTFSKNGMKAKNLTVSGLVWRSKSGSKYSTNKSLTASKAESILAKGGEIAFNYKMTPKSLSKKVSCSTKLVIVSPDGYEGTVNFGKVSYKSGGYLWCDTTGDSFFTWYYEKTGHIAKGKYGLYLYLDDELANYSTITMK